MNFELDNLKEQVLKSQQDYAAVQQRFASMSVLMYKADEVGILQIVTDSADLAELLARISQLEAVTQQSANLAAEQKRQAAQLQDDYDAVSQRKDDAEAVRAELELKKAAVDVARDRLAEQVSAMQAEAAAQAAQAAQAAAAAQAAKAAQAALEAAQQASSAAEATVAESAPPQQPSAEQESAEPEAAPDPAPAPEPEPEPATPAEREAEATFATSDTSGWSSGDASAYGGSSDPSTPNPGTTATGAICDDYSMGVAVPLAWGPAAYYGRQVEISYNGQSVIATVNDCGGMGGGSRHLDLQPGVFKAFGFSTCQDWGVRTVSYRFL